MINANLHTELEAVVRRYGLKPVCQALRRIELSEKRERAAAQPRQTTAESESRKKVRRKLTAVDRVLKMELPDERKTVVIEAAKRFDNRSFVPGIGDVRNFWLNHRIEGPPPPSRAAAAPRLFAFLAKMDMGELRKIVDRGYYSGPARLGPIADAIRDFGRERIRAWNKRNGLPDNPERVSAAGAGDPDGAADDRS